MRLALIALALSGCASVPYRYAPPEPLACSRAVAAAALRVAALPVCTPPTVDERACSLASVAAAIGIAECWPVAVPVAP